MSCPYPDCNGEIQRRGHLGHCQACYLPVFYCQGCDTENRSFARFCRRCGGKLTFPAVGLQEFLNENGHNFPKESRKILVDEIFWVSPIAYKGILWALSTKGNIISLTPFNSNPPVFAFLGDGFGKYPFIIREIITDPNTGRMAPHSTYRKSGCWKLPS